ncbi:hypothetical protein PMIN06_008840 [Paraphaeosphaeria minitans]
MNRPSFKNYSNQLFRVQYRKSQQSFRNHPTMNRHLVVHVSSSRFLANTLHSRNESPRDTLPQPPPNPLAAPQSPPPQRKHVHVFETAAAAPYNTPAVPAASPTINCLVPTVACSGSTSLESSAEAMAVGAA